MYYILKQLKKKITFVFVQLTRENVDRKEVDNYSKTNVENIKNLLNLDKKHT